VRGKNKRKKKVRAESWAQYIYDIPLWSPFSLETKNGLFVDGQRRFCVQAETYTRCEISAYNKSPRSFE
jgi:hypothetical protein